MAGTGSGEVPFPDFSDVRGVRVATLEDAVVVYRIDKGATTWAWRHGTSARARACVAVVLLAIAAAVLSALSGFDWLAVAAVGIALVVLPAVAAATSYDMRTGIRRTLRGSKRIILLSDDETAFIVLARVLSRGSRYWFVGRHAAIRVGEGHGARLRKLIWDPMITQADGQRIHLAAIVPVRFEEQLLAELPGLHRTGWLPFGRSVERSPVATQIPAAKPSATG